MQSDAKNFATASDGLPHDKAHVLIASQQRVEVLEVTIIFSRHLCLRGLISQIDIS